MDADFRKLLEDTWLNGFTHGLNPGEVPDAFEKWIDSMDLRAWLVLGNLDGMA